MNEIIKPNNFSRRNFLKLLGISTTVFVMPGFIPDTINASSLKKLFRELNTGRVDFFGCMASRFEKQNWPNLIAEQIQSNQPTWSIYDLERAIRLGETDFKKREVAINYEGYYSNVGLVREISNPSKTEIH